ncbi:MAG: hypothetical protein VW931_06370, partial [Alphaproteobacteria bacterium]
PNALCELVPLGQEIISLSPRFFDITRAKRHSVMFGAPWQTFVQMPDAVPAEEVVVLRSDCHYV